MRSKIKIIERAKASFNAGATAYAAGEYLAAIQALESAYALTPIPAIAFSLAQAERRQYFVLHQREHLSRAIALFRGYIEQTPSGGRRADALEALSQLEPIAALPPDAVTTRAVAETVRRTRLMVTSEAPGALVSLDGQPGEASPFIREVAVGKHRVSVAAEGFFPDQRELTAIEGELIPEVVTLRERPSTLVITAPASAEVYLDGAFASHGGDKVTLKLPGGAHRVAVAESGHRVVLRSLELERGKSQHVVVQLEPTLQRRAAVIMFVSGAAALGAGAVFTGLAVHSEDRAQMFLDRQAHENVSSADLANYDGDVANRGRFRAATVVSLAASAGFFITGLFLVRPRSTELRATLSAHVSLFARRHRPRALGHPRRSRRGGASVVLTRVSLAKATARSS